jgi:co-chaperonin GroES (HSP10)
MILYRVPPPKEKERTEGGLVIPLGYTDPKTGEFIAADGRELAPRPLALLIACGASALDWCMSHGILPGDMVCFGEWEGRERDFDDGKSDTYQRELKKFLMMKVAAIRGSVDLIERMGGKKPQMRLVPHFTDDGVVHLVEPVAENIL